ncbi:dihydrolipoamide acetyltransferase family protein [Fervidibacillus halotolerans]|uniref:Dihydrolipoamide acetyltransferase component of pyruvate dehydrogenase complex n=1 Tax=Fervidibacillus halotolerans TaxID=2980027 RepID=A0A9E8LXJ3_9BACI|nr:dihydrolipoamide acetyltransferase family protein [Fervidibacillus halotolerans]WAA11404.1 2-oxo acid dehydrogenase subunit E2 [Fervidibacillus halotolerans]
MAIEAITMPQLGESVTEGTISKWLVSKGDKVNKYDPIAEVVTDKVNAEIPSSFTGVISEIVAEEGSTLKVGEVICKIETEEERPQTEKTVTKEEKPREDEKILQNNKYRYSPAVLKLSQQHNIDLSMVKGTGKGGRITRKDVLAFIQSQSKSKEELTVESKERTLEKMTGSAVKEEKREPVKANVGDTEIPVTGVRKVIAENMVRSKREIPHAWTMMEADVTGLVQYRDSLKDQFKRKEGFNLTYFAFFVKAVAQALIEFPEMNATWAGDKIIRRKDIHISIAVATDDALFVPVIKHADEKSIKGIARDIAELSEKVRNNQLRPEDSQGGTFTVNNTGSFGSVQSMGIINYPQAAILQVESIVKRPVIKDGGMIAIRDMVNLCLSLDHRVIDGLVAGRFLNRVKEIVENMNKDTISIY